ncbi:hypothetical protein PTSG_08299 [Salpingoeca rosetta]|uniref:Uncharacterized protein n=1 Tax=Salpingoeca rosetta (strain ATCC 50818 / BSB-021) TaxID=946362 RepID=F2UJA8_SALR5|nr:uncharacterized protein PTSG_08299 [Salpingoeca rosetta]EGD77207.1 hypothetical protein PTSG_08299 [Salpingoeca rosetta]|eukprot:XP_004990551.1 hypothetical protein PTSG_08299 [Salpingoeca rosetta]
MGRVARYKKVKAIGQSQAPKKKRGKKHVRHSARDTFGVNDIITAEGDVGRAQVVTQGILPSGLPAIPSIPGLPGQTKKAKNSRKKNKFKKGRKGEGDDDEELLPQAPMDPEALRQHLEEQGGGKIIFRHASATEPVKQETKTLRQIKKKQWKTKKERKRQERRAEAMLAQEEQEHEPKKDVVAFGEVAQAPPELTAQPRKKHSNLSKEQRKKMAPVQQLRLEQERERVIALYRQQKQRRRQLQAPILK